MCAYNESIENAFIPRNNCHAGFDTGEIRARWTWTFRVLFWFTAPPLANDTECFPLAFASFSKYIHSYWTRSYQQPVYLSLKHKSNTLPTRIHFDIFVFNICQPFAARIFRRRKCCVPLAGRWTTLSIFHDFRNQKNYWTGCMRVCLYLSASNRMNLRLCDAIDRLTSIRRWCYSLQ